MLLVMLKTAGCQVRQLALKGRIRSAERQLRFAVVRLPRTWMKFKIVMFGSTSHIGRSGGSVCLRCRSQMRQSRKNLSY